MHEQENGQLKMAPTQSQIMIKIKASSVLNDKEGCRLDSVQSSSATDSSDIELNQPGLLNISNQDVSNLQRV